MSSSPRQGEADADHLSELLRSLELLLHGLCGRAITVQPLPQKDADQSALRPILTWTHLLLPSDYPESDDGYSVDPFRLYRAAVAHAVAHLRFSDRSRSTLTLKPMGIAIVSAIEDARVERLLMREYPGVRAWFLELLRLSVKPAGLGFADLVGRMNLALIDPLYQDDNFWVNKARRLFEAQAENLTDYSAFRSLASILANDLGQMRVPFRVQRYCVPEPYRDDNSFLWNFTDASDPSTQALDLHLHTQEALEPASNEQSTVPFTFQEIEVSRQTYPEWDAQRSLMRKDWCTVIEKLPGWHAGQEPTARSGQPVPVVMRTRLQHGSRRRRLRRQWEGDDIDLNAAIEAALDQRLQLQPDLRLFIRDGREQRKSSVLVLLDLSESTNDCPGAMTESILDIEKQAAKLLLQSARQSGDRIAIHGFSSNTRDEVNYYPLIEFGTPLDAAADATIEAMQGRYSTRMGAALRHATTRMEHEPFENRSIVLVTDGAPSDIDVFKPEYLIEDARAVVQEARRGGIMIFCVALDPQADPYVRRIFGWGNYRVVDQPSGLPAQLSSFYSHIATS